MILKTMYGRYGQVAWTSHLIISAVARQSHLERERIASQSSGLVLRLQTLSAGMEKILVLGRSARATMRNIIARNIFGMKGDTFFA